MAIIPPLEENQAEEPAKMIYKKFEGKTGKVPEWAKVMAYQPRILKEFSELFDVIMSNHSLEPFMKWKIACVVSNTLKCKFCVDVTEKMLKSFGASEDVLEKIKKGEGETEKDRDLLELIKEVTLEAHVCKPELYKKIEKEFSHQEIVEIISIIGLFNYINRFNNTFCILPE